MKHTLDNLSWQSAELDLDVKKNMKTFRGIQRNEFWKLSNRITDAVNLHYNDDVIRRKLLRRVVFRVKTNTHISWK